MLGAGLIAWANLPKIREPELHRELWEEALLRHQTLQIEGKDPKVNAYLSPKFRPFWGIDPDVQGGTPVERTIQGWLDYELKEDNSQTQLSQRKEFETLLAELRVELGKPNWVPLGDMSSRHRSYVNDYGLGLLRESVLKLAFVLAEEGDYDACTETVCLVLNLADKLIGCPGFGAPWAGREMLSLTITEFSELVNPKTPMGTNWSRISSALLSAGATRAEFMVWFEDVIAEHRSLNRSTPMGSVFSSMFGRKERMFCNVVDNAIVASRMGRVPRIPDAIYAEETLSVFCPSQKEVNIMVQMHRETRRELLSFGVATSLLGYRDAMGEFPDKLDQLDLAQPLSQVEWDSSKQRLEFRWSADVTSEPWIDDYEQCSNWVTRNETSWVFDLSV